MTHPEPTTYPDLPEGPFFYQLILTRAHLRIHANTPLRHSKMPASTLLSHAGKLTGKQYKRGQFQRAITDIEAAIEKVKAHHKTATQGSL